MSLVEDALAEAMRQSAHETRAAMRDAGMMDGIEGLRTTGRRRSPASMEAERMLLAGADASAVRAATGMSRWGVRRIAKALGGAVEAQVAPARYPTARDTETAASGEKIREGDE